MKTPTSEDNNSSLDLVNVMMNVWHPLVDILNNGTAYSICGNEEDFQWLKSYLHDDDDEKTQLLKTIFEKMK
jgi:hypothetical protein